jgi:hypothetical protein
MSLIDKIVDERPNRMTKCVEIRRAILRFPGSVLARQSTWIS